MDISNKLKNNTTQTHIQVLIFRPHKTEQNWIKQKCIRMQKLQLPTNKTTRIHNRTLQSQWQRQYLHSRSRIWWNGNGAVPNAKQKVKIADKMFPMMAETKRVPTLLTFSTKFPKKPVKGHWFGTDSIWVSQKLEWCSVCVTDLGLWKS